MQITSFDAHADTAAFITAVACAERQALHSFFDQHVIQHGEGVYAAIDEGDYDVLPAWLIDRVVHTVHGIMHDVD